MNSKADVYEDFPDKIINKFLTVLFLYVRWEVTMLAILHNYIDSSVINEGIVVSNYEMWIKLS